jgi:hypothetical protein
MAAGEPPPGELDEAGRRRLMRRAETLIAGAFEGAGVQSEIGRYRARRQVASLLSWERENAGWRPEQFEVAFGEPGAPAGRREPVPVPLPGEGALLFTGKVDRIDVGPDRARVVDYKTGKQPSGLKPRFKLGDPISLQPVVYALAAPEIVGQEAAESGLLYLGPPHASSMLAGSDLPEVLEKLGPVLAELVACLLAGWFVPTAGAGRGTWGACGRCRYGAACGPAVAHVMTESLRGLAEGSEDRRVYEFLRAPVKATAEAGGEQDAGG